MVNALRDLWTQMRLLAPAAGGAWAVTLFAGLAGATLSAAASRPTRLCSSPRSRLAGSCLARGQQRACRRNLGDTPPFNPIATVFEPLSWPRRFRFYRAFRSFKHGRPDEVETLRREFLQLLNELTEVFGDGCVLPISAIFVSKMIPQ